VREAPNECQQVGDGLAVDVHVAVFMGQDDTMLRIVGIGRILEIPGFAAQFDPDHAVGGPGRVPDAAGIPLVFDAQKAARIAAAALVAGRGDVAGVFFRFGQVDRDVKHTVR